MGLINRFQTWLKERKERKLHESALVERAKRAEEDNKAAAKRLRDAVNGRQSKSRARY